MSVWAFGRDGSQADEGSGHPRILVGIRTGGNNGDQFMFGPEFLINLFTEDKVGQRAVGPPVGADWDKPETARPFAGGQVTEGNAPHSGAPIVVRARSRPPFAFDIRHTVERLTDPIRL